MALCFLVLFCCFLTGIRGLRLLDAVRKDAELSIFAGLIDGASGGIPNPDIEARFNSAKDGRSYTLFAPTNGAFSEMGKPLLNQFGIPQNYPLLLSLIRTHIVEDRINATAFPEAGKTSTLSSVEGFPLRIIADERGPRINNDYYKSPINTQAPIEADNGIIYKIERVLDPYSSSFGISWTDDVATPSKPTQIDSAVPRQENKTMTDLLQAEPLLSDWTAIMTKVLYGILKRLSDRRGPEGKDCVTPHPFAVLPTNEAMSHLPANYTKVLQAPFNFALSSHILAWSLSVPTCASFDDIMKAVRENGKFEIFSHRADINLTVREMGNGVLTVNNARVVMANRCAGNGCIWMVDRLISPVFGMFQEKAF